MKEPLDKKGRGEGVGQRPPETVGGWKRPIIASSYTCQPKWRWRAGNNKNNIALVVSLTWKFRQ